MIGKSPLAAVPLALLLATAGAAAEPPGFVKPGERDRCPVCGMFVARHPDWVAQIHFKGGGREFFDGVKDLCLYYFGMRSSGGGRGPGDVTAVYVNDFYTLEPIDGKTAFYVVGSDVTGPMGKELIPFAHRDDAEEFRRDHAGRRIVVFDEIERELGNLKGP